MKNCYSKSLGGQDNLSLLEHTQNVIQSFERYYESKVALLLPNFYFKILLALHDLGKPQAIRENAPEKQHMYTLKLIEIINKEFQISEDSLTRICIIINGDPIGRYLNSKHEYTISESLGVLHDMASALSVPILKLWRTILVYHQCDAAGYPSLVEKVFKTDTMNRPIYSNALGRLLLKNPEEMARFHQLERAVIYDAMH